ncbi:hypothetical protein ODJ79_42780 [Actinoplanes sp. KI2]|uniref:hypothetical protein n=1 Tax=Actinoplanes sp. KI2 TaxID=2983315 RepID=UPI0021D5B579|nr:hypothetical protein [Actinoplanes sp. KI2]MCU7730483.1 hypothetical protein [Actinoplanes sp. KI2]
MPHRRLAALPLVLLATATLAAGCAIEISPDSKIPTPFSVAPTPSASAGVPKYVCTAAYKILTDGAVSLAEGLTASGDRQRQRLHDSLTDMATKLTAEAARTPDVPLQEALTAVAADLTAGAQQADPKAYVNGGFQVVGQKLDPACDKV